MAETPLMRDRLKREMDTNLFLTNYMWTVICKYDGRRYELMIMSKEGVGKI